MESWEYAAWGFSSHADPNWALINVAERSITIVPRIHGLCQYPTTVEFKEMPEVSSREKGKEWNNGPCRGI